MAELKRRLLNLLIASDQALWCLVTLGHSSPDMTFSAHCYYSELRLKRWAKICRPAVDLLFLPLETEHCYKSWLSEQHGKHLPELLRRP